jgi:hypothetical protein
MQRALSVACIAAWATAGGAWAGLARATPRPLPFTYNYESLGEGELEIEQYVDLDPVKVLPNSGNPAGVWVPASQFQTELEYGITSHFELGLYLTLAPSPPGSEFGQPTPSLTEGNGSKQRIRWRLFDEGKLPLDLGLYGEITENEREFEVEAKVILQRRFRNLRLMANLTGEHEWYWASSQQDWVFEPSAGLTYQVTPVFQPGLDAWMWLERSAPAIPGISGGTPFNQGPNAYVGPAVLLDFGKLWWSTGAYVRVTNFNHTMEPGVDAFGPIWIRMIFGISL